MPTWAIGISTSSTSRNAGFTLLELLVVLFIVAAFSGLVLLAPGLAGIERRLDEDAAMLAASLQLAGEESVLTGSHLAVSFTEGGWYFLRATGDDWLPVRRGPLSRPVRLETGTRMSVTLDGRTLELDRAEVLGEPHIVLFSSGEVLPFRVEFSHPASEVDFIVSPGGKTFTVTHDS